MNKKEILNSEERLQLSRMIKENNVEDMTEKIRKVRHSSLINKDTNIFIALKKKYSRVSKETFRDLCIKHCEFLYNNYTEMLFKLINNNLDVMLFKQFIAVLKEIENGEVDYHEGSYKIGSILKKIYIDTMIENTSNNEKNKKEEKTEVKHRKISWAEFKLKSK